MCNMYLSMLINSNIANIRKLEKVLKLTKMLKLQDKLTLTHSYTGMHQKSFKLRLLQFLNYIYIYIYIYRERERERERIAFQVNGEMLL